MTPELSAHTDRVRATWAFLAEFGRRVRESRAADIALMSEARRAVDESQALLRQVAIDHPNV